MSQIPLIAKPLELGGLKLWSIVILHQGRNRANAFLRASITLPLLMDVSSSILKKSDIVYQYQRVFVGVVELIQSYFPPNLIQNGVVSQGLHGLLWCIFLAAATLLCLLPYIFNHILPIQRVSGSSQSGCCSLVASMNSA